MEPLPTREDTFTDQKAQGPPCMNSLARSNHLTRVRLPSEETWFNSAQAAMAVLCSDKNI